MKAGPAALLKVIAPYREELVVAVECIFTRYWLADLCTYEVIPLVLGHALYKGKALTVLAHMLARAVYYMLKRDVVFDLDILLQS